jgi:hypothetical protein
MDADSFGKRAEDEQTTSNLNPPAPGLWLARAAEVAKKTRSVLG